MLGIILSNLYRLTNFWVGCFIATSWDSLYYYFLFIHEVTEAQKLSKVPKSMDLVGFGREGHHNPLQYSHLENPRDRGALWAVVYGVTQIRTWLKWLSSSSSCLENPMDGGAWCRLLSMGSQRVRHDWVTSFSLNVYRFFFHFKYQFVHSTFTTWESVSSLSPCLTLCILMDCSLPDSSVHGIL